MRLEWALVIYSHAANHFLSLKLCGSVPPEAASCLCFPTPRVAIQHLGSFSFPSLLRGGWAIRCGLPPSATAPWGSGPGQPLLSPPTWLGEGSPMHALQALTSPVLPSDRHPGAPSMWFQVLSLSPKQKPCRNCRDLIHHLGHLLHWQSILHFGQHGAEDCPDLKTTFMPNFLQTRLISSLTPLCVGEYYQQGSTSPLLWRCLGGLHILASCRRQRWRTDEGTEVTILLQDLEVAHTSLCKFSCLVVMLLALSYRHVTSPLLTWDGWCNWKSPHTDNTWTSECATTSV